MLSHHSPVWSHITPAPNLDTNWQITSFESYQKLGEKCFGTAEVDLFSIFFITGDVHHEIRLESSKSWGTISRADPYRLKRVLAPTSLAKKGGWKDPTTTATTATTATAKTDRKSAFISIFVFVTTTLLIHKKLEMRKKIHSDKDKTAAPYKSCHLVFSNNDLIVSLKKCRFVVFECWCVHVTPFYHTKIKA